MPVLRRKNIYTWGRMGLCLRPALGRNNFMASLDDSSIWGCRICAISTSGFKPTRQGLSAFTARKSGRRWMRGHYQKVCKNAAFAGHYQKVGNPARGFILWVATTIQVSLWPDSKHFEATKSREILPQTSQLFPNKFSIHQVLKISNKISTLMNWSNKSVIRSNSDIVPVIAEGQYFIATNICSKTCWFFSFCLYTQSNKLGNINDKIIG